MNNKAPGDEPFIDDEERELIESFEAALEHGAARPQGPAALRTARARWKDLVKSTNERKAITLRLQQRDIERLKVIARQRGMPYQTLVTSILHQFANGDLKERRG